MPLSLLRSWISQACDLVAPVLCPLCGRRLGPGSACRACGLPDRGLVLRELRASREGPLLVLGGGLLRGGLRRLVHAHKYAQAPGALSLLAVQTALAVPSNLRWDALVAVPAHPTRARERGGDTVCELTRRLADLLAVPVLPVLRRVRYTEPLTGKGHWQRREIVAQAFRARRAQGCLLLVDDVRTTGATAAACRRVLLAAGARAVDCLVAARTPDRIGVAVQS